MNKRNISNQVIIIGHLIFILSPIVLCVTLSEIYYYHLNGQWYTHRSPQALSHSEAENGMSLYRKPFSLVKGDRFRILCIGGSTTYSMGVSYEHSWPNLLQKKFNESFSEKFEVINLGRIGGHLEEFINNYQNSSNIYISREKWIRGLRPLHKDLSPWGWKDLQPDFIILVPIINDTAPDYLYLLKPNFVSLSADFVLNLFDNSYFFENMAIGFYFKKFLTILKVNNKEHFYNENLKIEIIKREYLKNLKKFIDLWDVNLNIHMFGLPLLFNKNDGEKQAYQAASYWNITSVDSLLKEAKYMPLLDDLEKTIRLEVSKIKGLPYKELGGHIKKQSFSKRLRLYIDSIHMNSKGNAIIAEEIFKNVAIDIERIVKKRSFEGNK